MRRIRCGRASSRHLHFLGNRDLHFDRFRHLDTVEAADRLIEGIDQADLDTFVAVLAKLKENADNYSNNG